MSDLRQNLSTLGDTVANSFLDQLDKEVITETGFTIKSPFQDQLNQKLRNEFYQTTASYGINQYYTLYKTSPNPQAFLKGDFTNGGFNAFFSASQNPANNPFGAYLAANNQLQSQIDSATKAREAELSWSKGFLPWRGNCNSASSAVQQFNQAAGAPAVSLGAQDNCLFSTVKTPGSVIESQLENSLGSGIRQLELADSINEIVGALIGQMVNQVLGSGGLSGLSQPAPGGGQAYISQATNANAYVSANSSIANGVIQNIKDNQTAFTDYRDEWQRVLDAANAAQQRCGASSASSAQVSQAIVTASSGVARGTVALQRASDILAEVTAASQSTAADASTKITKALADYQSYTGFRKHPVAVGDCRCAGPELRHEHAHRYPAKPVQPDGAIPAVLPALAYGKNPLVFSSHSMRRVPLGSRGDFFYRSAGRTCADDPDSQHHAVRRSFKERGHYRYPAGRLHRFIDGCQRQSGPVPQRHSDLRYLEFGGDNQMYRYSREDRGMQDDRFHKRSGPGVPAAECAGAGGGEFNVYGLQRSHPPTRQGRSLPGIAPRSAQWAPR